MAGVKMLTSTLSRTPHRKSREKGRSPRCSFEAGIVELSFFIGKLLFQGSGANTVPVHGLFSPLTTYHRMHVIGHIMALLDTIEDHALGDGDHFGNKLVQDADNRTLVTAICVRVGDEGEELIGEFAFVGQET